MRTKRRSPDQFWKATQTLQAKTAEIIQGVPESLPTDLLHLTVCCRYLEALIGEPRVKRYISKYHPAILDKIEKLLAAFNSPYIVLERRKAGRRQRLRKKG
jgi:hypothetical protein